MRARGNVTLTVTEGSVVDTDNANDVVGNVAAVTVSNGSFGAAGSGNAIVTNVNELSVSTTNGSIWASEVNGLIEPEPGCRHGQRNSDG